MSEKSKDKEMLELIQKKVNHASIKFKKFAISSGLDLNVLARCVLDYAVFTFQKNFTLPQIQELVKGTYEKYEQDEDDEDDDEQEDDQYAVLDNKIDMMKKMTQLVEMLAEFKKMKDKE